MAAQDLRAPATAPASPRAPAAGPDADRELAAAILRKDRKATAQFVADHVDPVHAYVKRRLVPRADLVEDVVQEVFLAALASLDRYRGSSSLRSWVLGIARHKVEDFYRAQLRAPLMFDEDHEGPAAHRERVDETLARKQVEHRARRVLRQLPDRYAIALLWRYWENRSAREIAAETGRTEKAVERLLARARVRFRRLWET